MALELAAALADGVCLTHTTPLANRCAMRYLMVNDPSQRWDYAR